MESTTVRRFGIAGLLLAALVFADGLRGPSGSAVSGENRKPILVELSGPPAAVVAEDAARRSGAGFDRAAHDRQVGRSQAAFLAQLRRADIAYTLTETPFYVAGVRRVRSNRFGHLINAVGIEVLASDIPRIRSMPGVRHVSPDEPVRPHLDLSVPYVRASDGPGNKTIFTQAGGPLTRFDGSGQVIAVLDTGIEHSHPMFDTRFPDTQFQQRTGDVRPVRLAGQPYVEGVNHPKVVYSLTLTAATNEDDVGHGTHGAADSAGLKAIGPGLDRIPGNEDDQIVEGVAPGALLMNYKVCETIFTCVGTTNIVTALEDAVSPTDPLGFPKPVATVINMSFGGGGSPDDASAVAASNAALAGAVPVASAGNSGPDENTHGAPAAGRRVIGVGATIDPGSGAHQVDVLVPDPIRYTVAGSSTGAQNDAGRPAAPEDRFIKGILMGGAPDVTFPLGQHYVYVGLADTPSQVPDAVAGRIALASRGSSVDLGASGTGLFGHKAAEVAARGAVALLVFNNVDAELEAATTQAAAIPVFGVSKVNGEYLRDALGFQDPGFDKNDPSTWGTISDFPIRIAPPEPSNFSPEPTGFSSRGPVDNYRYVKPDITAPGQNIYAATIPAGGVQVQPLPPAVGGTMSDPSRYISVSGTSFSGPHVAGAAALVRQALLAARGQSPLPAAGLRSGASAAAQLAQGVVVPPSLVRAALTNTATNLRERDNVTPVPDADDRNFIHAIGSGLLHVAQAVDARVAMGTDDSNGDGGPDDADAPDFLPTHSFGENVVIDTDDPAQVRTITVTLENISGVPGGGLYALILLDGGALRGDVTRPISGTTGFSVVLSTSSVLVPALAGASATFDVTVTVDGRPAPDGLAVAGFDVNGVPSTEFLWWVVASGTNGEVVRMPFYYRASAVPQVFREAPFQNAIQDDATPDQEGGVDRDGNYRLSWTFPGSPAEQPCAFQIEEATSLTALFSDDGTEPLVAGANSRWIGDAEWISSAHPTTLTPGYSVVYHDLADVSLEMADPVAIPAGTRAQIVFDSFEDIEEDFDFGTVEVSGDGAPYLPVASYTGTFSGQRVIDISGFSGKSVRIRFRLVSDLLISSPLWLGWFVDNIEIQTADWTTLGQVGSSTTQFDVTNRASGTYTYRIAGLFGVGCDEVGSYSNLRTIRVDREGTDPTLTPTASFTAAPNPAQVAELVTFDGSASTDNDAVGCDPGSDSNRCIGTWFWSFGDGATLTTTSPTAQHAYAAPGTYRVVLTVTDNDGETGSTEAFVEVVAQPPAGEQDATGGGWIGAGGGDKANFGFHAKRKGVEAPSGHLTYDDKPGHVKVLSESITSLTVSGNQATFTGTCSVNKVSGFTFTVEVVDNGEPGGSDTFRIRLSNGYQAAGTLGGGNIQVRSGIGGQQRSTETASDGL
jgi:PKD repeat protein